MRKNYSEDKYEESEFKTEDGFNIYEQRWFPEKDSKAVVIIVHGYGEHSSRYSHVAEKFTANGFIIETFDLRGHGKSDGDRTFINSFDEYVSDLELFFTRVQKRHPDLPVLLLGHSMGGSVAILFTLKNQGKIESLILSGALLKVSDDISPILITLANFFGRIFPKLPTIKLDSNAISRDKEIVNKYISDPLVYNGKIPARTGAEINRAIISIENQRQNIFLPLFVMHGAADRLTDPKGSQALFQNIKSENKAIKLYDNLYHEILNEPEKENVMDDILEWINKILN